jgi:hypothetical protein
MSSDGKLMKMLTVYAASHQHPFNFHEVQAQIEQLKAQEA